MGPVDAGAQMCRLRKQYKRLRRPVPPPQQAWGRNGECSAYM